jgi:hypothetical protein
VERDEIDEFDEFDEINRIEEDETETVKENASFSFLCKFQYKKEIVMFFFYNIKAVSNFDFVK